MRYASVYPLLTARAVARPFTYEVDDGVEVGSIVAMRFGGRRTRGVVVGFEPSPPEGVSAVPVESVVGQVAAPLVELVLWLAD